MGLLDLCRRKKVDESPRVARLLQTGRIVEGTLGDVTTDSEGKGTQVLYCYHVSSVEYESSHAISPAQQISKTRYLPGTQTLGRATTRVSPQIQLWFREVISCLLLTDSSTTDASKTIASHNSLTTDY